MYPYSSLIAIGFLTLAISAQAQTASGLSAGSAPVVEGLPAPLTWQNPPADWKVDGGRTLTITAGKGTDWFVSPMGDGRRDNSSRLLFKPADDFAFSAKVTVDFRSQWDSGVLVVYANDTVWAKLCFEMTIYKRPSIVSVVTRGLSDDSNSIELSGTSVYLKVAKAGQAIFFYASEDGENWRIIRAFSLGPTPDLRVGFSSQSPAGDGCKSVFSEIKYVAKRVDLWTGK